jgi:predicted 3-demethylubiquinone-9 3-methyltransferase (glyoxalase superfamily)
MQKIRPCLWFDGKAEEAARFYGTIFKNSKIITSGPVVTVFTIEGQEFMGLNGGPKFPFTEAVSFMVHCDTQAELDEKWEKLTADGGRPVECGWLKDKYGLCWQIVPTALQRLMMEGDKASNERVMAALMKMTKLDIATFEAAAKG